MNRAEDLFGPMIWAALHGDTDASITLADDKVIAPPDEDCTTLDTGRWHYCPESSRDGHHGCVDLDVTPDHIQVVATWPAIDNGRAFEQVSLPMGTHNQGQQGEEVFFRDSPDVSAPGTILNLTGATPGWAITFTQAGRSWSSPIVAWANLTSEYGNGLIDPVMVADTGQTVTLGAYLEGQGPLLDVLDTIDYTITWAPVGVATPTQPGDLSALATVTVTGCWTLTVPTGENPHHHWATRAELETHLAMITAEGWEVSTDLVRSTNTCRVAVCATCGVHLTHWEGAQIHHPTATQAITAAVTEGRTDPGEWEPGDAWTPRPDGRLDCPKCATNEGNDR